MIIKTSFLAAISLFMLSCTAQNGETKEDTASTKNNMVEETNAKIKYFPLGSPIFIKGLEANITFKSVVEDSRCPEGSNCVWAGVAKVNLEIMGTYTRPQTIELASARNPANIPTSTEFNGYTITLKEVHPYPKTDIKKGEQNTAKEQKIGLLIEKK